MLKIKDNVDLRTLKKYKFNLNGIYIFKDRTICLLPLPERNKQTDLLYDLIKANIIEKIDRQL